MQAVRLLRWQSEPELVTIPVPEPGPGEVLKVEAAGLGTERQDPRLHSTPFSQLDAESEVIKVKIIEPNEHGLSEMGRPASIGILPRRAAPRAAGDQP